MGAMQKKGDVTRQVTAGGQGEIVKQKAVVCQDAGSIWRSDEGQ